VSIFKFTFAEKGSSVISGIFVAVLLFVISCVFGGSEINTSITEFQLSSVIFQEIEIFSFFILFSLILVTNSSILAIEV